MRCQERLQKIIASAGIASRRKAETLIREGRVSLNGEIVTELGTKADPARDHIKVDGRPIRRFPEKIYTLLNKPRQVISSVSDPEGRVRVVDLVPVKQKLYPVGRLDYNTEGLILLTNDGSFSRIVSAAGESFPKVYHVKVRSVPDDSVLKRLRAGIRLRTGVQLAGCKVVLAGGTQMAAVLALGKSLGIEGDISIATTKYIVEDKTASFLEIVESTGRPYYYADPGLENSKIPGVQIYAQGYVKEGVGMGGASLLAGLYGVTQKQLVEETDRVLMTVELPKK